MEMLQENKRVDIIETWGHYEGRVDGEFIVSGDTWNEVHNDLLEMGYVE